MKRDYVTIVSLVLSAVMLILLIGARTELTRVSRDVDYLNSQLNSVRNDVSYLHSSIREMQEIMSQEDIIVSVESGYEVLDLMGEVVEATLTMKTSNIHKDSVAKLIYEKKEYSKTEFVTEIHEWTDDMYEITETEVKREPILVESGELEMTKTKVGEYQVVFPVEFTHAYEFFVVIEHDGIIYQEEIRGFTVYDETLIEANMFIHHFSKAVKDEIIEIDVTIDLYNRTNTSVEDAVIIVKADGEVIHEENYMDELTRFEDEGILHGSTTVFDYPLEVPYVDGSVYEVVFILTDEYGREVESTQIIELK